ncbi:MAG: HypC/HybG/HupF family hydrogenase formation chaperone [Bifidobacteriaceae bacterium]|nr:HypC/HybG/HupF family hydrogenase formation chaperone [Bifidobacteriaceae bacterium]
MSFAQPAACDGPTCITCSDEATLAEVVRPPAGAWDDAVVQTAAGTETADVSLVGPVAVGDLVLVHAGTAIERVEPDSADAPTPGRPLAPRLASALTAPPTATVPSPSPTPASPEFAAAAPESSQPQLAAQNA